MIGFGIWTGLLFLVMAAVLELNKNTLLGFGLLIAATVAFTALFLFRLRVWSVVAVEISVRDAVLLAVFLRIAVVPHVGGQLGATVKCCIFNECDAVRNGDVG